MLFIFFYMFLFFWSECIVCLYFCQSLDVYFLCLSVNLLSFFLAVGLDKHVSVCLYMCLYVCICVCMSVCKLISICLSVNISPPVYHYLKYKQLFKVKFAILKKHLILQYANIINLFYSSIKKHVFKNSGSKICKLLIICEAC